MRSFKYWGKSSSSSGGERGPTQQLQPSRNNNAPYPTIPLPEQSYDSDIKDEQHIQPAASSSNHPNSRPNSVQVIPAGRGAPSTAEYESHLSPTSPVGDKQEQQVNRKSIKSKFGLPNSSREELPEPSKEPTKGIFGRKKSVAQRKEPSTQQLISNTSESQGQWPLGVNQPAQRSESGTFEPYGPDFEVPSTKPGNYNNISDTTFTHSNTLQYQTSPVPGGHSNGSETQFQNYSGPTAQASPIRQRLISRQNSHDVSPAHHSSQPSSRPSSRHSQNHPSTVPHAVSQLTLVETAQQEVRPREEENVIPQIQRTSVGPMPPPHGVRQPRRGSAQYEQVKAGTPMGPSRENSLHPAGAGLTKQVSQSTQSSHDGETTPNTNKPLPPANQMSEADLQRLHKDHAELKLKYNNVKRQYFEKKDQVEALQNSLAQQRLSQSRTCLDDGEYSTRMTRLDGLVSQLAFGIRKDWRTIPDWLSNSINKDALAIGTREMTVVGRAVMSRWLADEFFNRYFHPGLEVGLSEALKRIQRNIYTDSPPPTSPEDSEALISKIISWRLATAEGLKSYINVPEASPQRMSFTALASEQLVQELQRYVAPSAALEGGIRMIIEVAVGILANLPQESRDIGVEYYMPGWPFHGGLMRAEGGIPASGPGDRESVAGSPADAETAAGSATDGDAGAEAKKKSQSRAGTPTLQKAIDNGQPRQVLVDGGNGQQGQAQAQGQSPREEGPGTVRMSAFLAVHIRGKVERVIYKAPVYRM